MSESSSTHPPLSTLLLGLVVCIALFGLEGVDSIDVGTVQLGTRSLGYWLERHQSLKTFRGSANDVHQR
jgi:hypothetical protein